LGHGAKNTGIIRRFALVRHDMAKGSVETRRERAGRNRDSLLDLMQIK
jgi:hypothetical protein